jgi:hypothetical protein
VLGWVVGPLGVAAIGAAVVWREADEAQRRRWTRTGTAVGGRTAVLRTIAGVLFVGAGIAVFLLGQLQLGQVQFALLAVVVTLLGVGVITVPWWVRLVRELTEERRERIAETERAEIAATCTTRCCRPSPSSSASPTSRARSPGWPGRRSASCAPGSTAPAGTGAACRPG